jgi:hypothetical protein
MKVMWNASFWSPPVQISAIGSELRQTQFGERQQASANST